MKTNLNNTKSTLSNIKSRALCVARKARAVLTAQEGQFVVDHALVFVIGVAVAAVVLGVATSFVQSDLAPAVTDKILGFMN